MPFIIYYQYAKFRFHFFILICISSITIEVKFFHMFLDHSFSIFSIFLSVSHCVCVNCLWYHFPFHLANIYFIYLWELYFEWFQKCHMFFLNLSFFSILLPSRFLKFYMLSNCSVFWKFTFYLRIYKTHLNVLLVLVSFFFFLHLNFCDVEYVAVFEMVNLTLFAENILFT